MPIPFPGMNPYLEHPDFWPKVHQKLMLALAGVLQEQLPSTYKVQLNERHYAIDGDADLIVGSPQMNWEPERHELYGQSRPIPVLVPVPKNIYEPYIEIVSALGETVTVIEALSPKKKRRGKGRDRYEQQREKIFGSQRHFVEIDLLRGWESPTIYGPKDDGDYRILVSRSEQRPYAQLHTWLVNEPIPSVAIPLLGYEELLVDIKAVVDQACDRTDLLVNYQQQPLPPLRPEENRWLEAFLQQERMRPTVR